MPPKNTASLDKFTRQTPAQVEVACSHCNRPQFVSPYKSRHQSRFYCDTECMLAYKRSQAQSRFWSKVDKTGDCWLWIGSKSAAGYGTFFHPDGYVFAHRFAYALEHGDVPDGMELDHLCRNRACVNPAHLEPVTHRENVFRGSAPAIVRHLSGVCHRGHEMNSENTYVAPNGRRQCRACRRLRRAGLA